MPVDVRVPEEEIPDKGGPDAAVEEARLLQEGDLEHQARRHRSSRMHHMHWIGIGCLWALPVVAVAVGGTSLWHFVTPPACHYLEAEQVSRVNTVFVTWIVSTLLAFVVQEATR